MKNKKKWSKRKKIIAGLSAGIVGSGAIAGATVAVLDPFTYVISWEEAENYRQHVIAALSEPTRDWSESSPEKEITTVLNEAYIPWFNYEKAYDEYAPGVYREWGVYNLPENLTKEDIGTFTHISSFNIPNIETSLTMSGLPYVSSDRSSRQQITYGYWGWDATITLQSDNGKKYTFGLKKTIDGKTGWPPFSLNYQLKRYKESGYAPHAQLRNYFKVFISEE